MRKRVVILAGLLAVLVVGALVAVLATRLAQPSVTAAPGGYQNVALQAVRQVLAVAEARGASAEIHRGAAPGGRPAWKPRRRRAADGGRRWATVTGKLRLPGS